ncbi:helix-turn-helix domain-containing protein [Leucobacter soli]|uniref:helix-turn-helix domain-containing protein n=1 Tax=Leucobacter soli TaxID=2812850 RepID=UPI00360F5927
MLVGDATVAEACSMIAGEAQALTGAAAAHMWRYARASGELVLETGVERRRVSWVPESTENAKSTETASSVLLAQHMHPDLSERTPRTNTNTNADVSAVDLVAAGDLAGVLVLEGAGSAVSESDFEEFLLNASAALSNVITLEEARTEQQQLATVAKLALELSSNLDIEFVLSTMLNQIRDLAGVPIAYIMMLDQSSSQLFMRASVGLTDPEYYGKVRLKLGVGLGGKAVEIGQIYYTDDYLTDERFIRDSDVDDADLREGIRSVIGVPMLVEDQFVGLLCLADREVRTFSDSILDLLERLAQHAGRAVQNASLYERGTSALSEVQRDSDEAQHRILVLMRQIEARRALNEIMLRDGGLDGLLAWLRQVAGGAIVALDEHHAPFGSQGDPDRVAELQEFAFARAHHRGPEGAEKHSRRPRSAAPPGREKRSGGMDGRRIMSVPITAAGVVLGSIWCNAANTDVDGLGEVLEEGANAVALELLRERSVAEVAERLGRELIVEIFGRGESDAEVLERRARGLGIELNTMARFCIVWPYARDSESAVAALAPCILASEFRGALVVLLTDAYEGFADTLEGVLEAASARESGAVISTVGWRSPHLATEFALAERLVKVAAGSSRQKRVLDLDRARVLGLLLGSVDGMETLDSFAEMALGPILRHASGDLGELVTTLETYLACRQSPQKTAEQLYVHVNTVYYRVNLIKKLLESDLSDPLQVLDLQIACLIRRFLK